MKFISLFLSVTCMLCNAANSIGSGDYIPISEAPFYVSIGGNGFSFFCGGSIISNHWILTAAHCVDYNYRTSKVVAGRTVNVFYRGSRHAIEKIFVYGDFAPVDFLLAHDIALLKLKTPIRFNVQQQPVRISSDLPKDGAQLLAYGIGYENASLITNKEHLCGAAILSEYWLVSAGHCVMSKKVHGWTKVRTGVTSRSGNGTIHTIDHVVVPDNYTVYTSEFRRTRIHINDIGLIKLEEPIKFDEYQQPIKLYPSSPKVNDTIVIVGLGRERVRQKPPSLKRTSHLVAATGPPFGHKPQSAIHLLNTTSHLCPGDSGSPGVIDNQLAGVHSFSDEMCRNWVASHENKYPGALTRIDMFYNWILEHTGIRY